MVELQIRGIPKERDSGVTIQLFLHSVFHFFFGGGGGRFSAALQVSTQTALLLSLMSEMEKPRLICVTIRSRMIFAKSRPAANETLSFARRTRAAGTAGETSLPEGRRRVHPSHSVCFFDFFFSVGFCSFLELTGSTTRRVAGSTPVFGSALISHGSLRVHPHIVAHPSRLTLEYQRTPHPINF